MKWLTNLYDPRSKDAEKYIITGINQTKMQEWRNQKNWLDGKTIGEPKATKDYTVEQLKEMGMVGVYAKDKKEH